MARILIIDDDPLVAQVASNILIGAGHACGSVTDPRGAFALMRWRRPDMVLLDQDMPEMTGIQFLRELRGSQEFYDLPVMMFTGISGEQDELAALYSGAQDYLRNPIEPNVLCRKVERILNKQDGHRSLRDRMLGTSAPKDPQRLWV